MRPPGCQGTVEHPVCSAARDKWSALAHQELSVVYYEANMIRESNGIEFGIGGCGPPQPQAASQPYLPCSDAMYSMSISIRMRTIASATSFEMRLWGSLEFHSRM